MVQMFLPRFEQFYFIFVYNENVQIRCYQNVLSRENSYCHFSMTLRSQNVLGIPFFKKVKYISSEGVVLIIKQRRIMQSTIINS